MNQEEPFVATDEDRQNDNCPDSTVASRKDGRRSSAKRRVEWIVLLLLLVVLVLVASRVSIVRVCWVRSLAIFGDRAVDKLRQYTNDEDRGVQEAAFAALQSLGPAAVPDLLQSLQDKDAMVRTRSAIILGKIGSRAKAAVPALEVAAADPDVGVRVAAIRALGNVGIDDGDTVVPILINALDRKKRNVCVTVMAALGKLGPGAAKAVPVLRELANDPTFPEADDAQEALEKILPQDESKPTKRKPSAAIDQRD
jgi:HEAT repeat protein